MSGNNIKVCCRFRPPNALELREGGDIVVSVDPSNTNVKLRTQEGVKGAEADGFTFDRVFNPQTEQAEVFDYGVQGIVDDVINGYNGTVFAYGQTGSGKTFTMMGSDIEDDKMKGLIPRITEQIFASIMSSPANLEYLVKVSFFEVYMERIRDLLAPQNDNLQVHEEKQKGVYVKGLSDYYVGGASEVLEIMRQGGQARVVSSTNMNQESSRSHSIFVITITQRNTETGSQKIGNLYLVDLAGSEKVGKTGASGQTLEEAKKINKSLSALGMVINALTDGKSSHIPYRDSKLTRILQESLGGNSRTTLIINCSPTAYNEQETLSTLRFGMRAKTIKNKARVNAELSAAELKAMLKTAQKDVGKYASYVNLLEAELQTWRTGGKVPPVDYASMDKATLDPPKSAAPPSTTSSSKSPTPSSRPFTPSIPAVEGLKEGAISRPDTPASVDKDEREEFLRRENELTDQLGEKESALATQEKLLQELKDEINFFREQDSTMVQDNKKMATELNELRLQIERLQYDNKEGTIMLDSVKEQNVELTNEIEELRRTINELKVSQRGLTQEGKDKKKAEKMAALMGNFESGGATDKEEEIRSTLAKLDDALVSSSSLSKDDMSALRRQFDESQAFSRDQEERLRHSADEVEILTRHKDELEARLATLEQDYEDLLDRNLPNDEQAHDLASEGTHDIRAKLEAQYVSKREAATKEISDLKQQLDLKTQENRNLSVTVESLKGANEALKRAFAVTTTSIEGGANLAESAKEMERIRKQMATQLSDFDTMKKALMKDLQDRCEKVVELEISLDDTREQYNTIVKSSNIKAQQRKMDFLTRNLDQLTSVQRQLVDQNMALKKDISVAERKLIARNERIQSLETLLQDSQEKLSLQNERFAQQMTEIRARLENARATHQQKPAGVLQQFGSRLAKPLRGQGSAPVPEPAKPLAGPAANSSRSSWFYS